MSPESPWQPGIIFANAGLANGIAGAAVAGDPPTISMADRPKASSETRLKIYRIKEFSSMDQPVTPASNQPRQRA